VIIDLRTEEERHRHPVASDIKVEVPVRLTPQIREWMRKTLLHIAGAHGPHESFDLLCASGHRATVAADILASAGYTVKSWGPA
jgi:rhodanese-related sulfurtransferase